NARDSYEIVPVSVSRAIQEEAWLTSFESRSAIRVGSRRAVLSDTRLYGRTPRRVAVHPSVDMIHGRRRPRTDRAGGSEMSNWICSLHCLCETVHLRPSRLHFAQLGQYLRSCRTNSSRDAGGKRAGPAPEAPARFTTEAGGFWVGPGPPASSRGR